MSVLITAFVAVFVAELGDKSQVMAASLAARYPRRILLLAVATTATLTVGLATLAGDVAGAFIPVRLTTALAGVLFVVFAVQAWRRPSEEDVDADDVGAGGFVSLVSTLTLAEFGDKTMLTTIGLASVSAAPVQVWVGGAMGMALAGALGVLAGGWLWARLSPGTVRVASAGLFLVIGLALLTSAAIGAELP